MKYTGLARESHDGTRARYDALPETFNLDALTTAMLQWLALELPDFLVEYPDGNLLQIKLPEALRICRRL